MNPFIAKVELIAQVRALQDVPIRGNRPDTHIPKGTVCRALCNYSGKPHEKLCVSFQLHSCVVDPQFFELIENEVTVQPSYFLWWDTKDWKEE